MCMFMQTTNRITNSNKLLNNETCSELTSPYHVNIKAFTGESKHDRNQFVVKLLSFSDLIGKQSKIQHTYNRQLIYQKQYISIICYSMPRAVSLTLL